MPLEWTYAPLEFGPSVGANLVSLIELLVHKATHDATEESFPVDRAICYTINY